MTGKRFYALDSLRGITLISMIAYHGMFDLVELYKVQVGWFWALPGYVWQQSICWTFILLSGFCWRLGGRPVRRGLIVSACGLAITAVTFVFLPSERIIFGILTFTGASMLALVPLSKWLERIPGTAGLIGSAFLFFILRNINSGYFGFEGLRIGQVPPGLYRGYVTAFFGFPQKGFFSGDYFSFFPWFFLYLCGYFLHGILMDSKKARRVLSLRCAVPEWIGRNSLVIYMLHQPALMAVFTVAFGVIDFLAAR